MPRRTIPITELFRASSEDAESALDPYRCEFCGELLRDKGLAFLEHVAETEACRFLWGHSNENAKREAGGT